MKNVWWKLPLYCTLASWVCFQLEIYVFGSWATVTSPDGVVSGDHVRWMLVSGGLFLAVVLLGGFLLCRKMTRREVALSATVLVLLNLVMGLVSYGAQGMVAFYWAELHEWDTFVTMVLYDLGLNSWLSAGISWVLVPYIFVLFGKKEANN